MKSTVFRLTAALCMAGTALSPIGSMAFERPVPLRATAMAGSPVLNLGDDDGGKKKKKGGNTGKIIACGAMILIGTLLGGKKGLAIGLGACAVTWAIAGLTKKDNDALTDRANQMAEDEDGPSTVAWQAPESKKNLQLQLGAPEQTEAKVEFAVDDGVQAPQQGTRLVSTPYVVVAQRLNFRTVPSASSPDTVRGYFEKGEVVQVIGLSPDGNWAAVGEDGVVVGYAALNANGAEALVTADRAYELNRPKAPPRGRKAPPAPTYAKVTKATPKAKPRFVNTASATMGSYRTADATKAKTYKVSALTTCKAMQASDGSRTDGRKTCQRSDGKYAMT